MEEPGRTKAAHVVAIGVLDKSESIVGNLIDKLDPLIIGRVINTSLQHTTTMTVGGNFNTVGSNCIVNELF
jgi:hypothetical protein